MLNILLVFSGNTFCAYVLRIKALGQGRNNDLEKVNFFTFIAMENGLVSFILFCQPFHFKIRLPDDGI